MGYVASILVKDRLLDERRRSPSCQTSPLQWTDAMAFPTSCLPTNWTEQRSTLRRQGRSIPSVARISVLRRSQCGHRMDEQRFPCRNIACDGPRDRPCSHFVWPGLVGLSPETRGDRRLVFDRSLLAAIDHEDLDGSLT